MIELFRKNEIPQGSRRIPGYFDELSNRLRSSVSSTIGYLQQYGLSVETDHHLARILDSLSVDLSQPLLEVVSRAQSHRQSIAHAHSINTPTRASSHFTEGKLFGESTREIWFDVDTDIDYLSFDQYWQYARPIRIFYHGSSNPIAPILDRRRQGIGGDAVIGIDIVLLAAQYHQWVQDQVKQQREFQQTPYQFLISYPIANALTEYADRAIFERIRKRFHQIDTEDIEHEWPFHIKTPQRMIDRYIDDKVDELYNRRINFEQTLASLAMVFSADAFELTRAPSGLRTQQIEWVHWYYQLPVLDLILASEFEKGANRSREHINDIKRRLRSLRSNKQLAFQMGPDLHFDFEQKVRNMVEIYLPR